MSIFGVLVLHYAKWNAETNHEKDLKELRRLWFMGKIDGKTFRYIRDNLEVEELFNNESSRLDRMIEQKKLDPFNYMRVKKALQMTVNNKLVTIENNYTSADQQKFLTQQTCS